MSVNQKGASAGHDMVGRDKYVTYNYSSAPRLTKVERLKARLQEEIANGKCSPGIIEQLQSFRKSVPVDGVTGLEAKLEAAGRNAQRIIAMEMKEQFAKLLDRWSLYASAQEIFVHLLAMTEYRFTHQIYPCIDTVSSVALDEMTEEKIIEPAIEEVGIEVFSLDHQTAMGMVYWLAEQCRIRWHK